MCERLRERDRETETETEINGSVIYILPQIFQRISYPPASDELLLFHLNFFSFSFLFFFFFLNFVKQY